LGPEHPLFAIQARGLLGLDREHTTITAMAEDYAALVRAARPEGPVRLLGWSMGGVIAHAVAGVLEATGVSVQLVGLVDPPSHATLGPEADAMALVGVAYDHNPSPPPPLVVFTEARRLAARALPPQELLRLCEERGLLPPGAVDAALLERALRLFQHHFDLVRDHRPGIVRAPLALFWAENAGEEEEADWRSRTTGRVSSEVVGGTHYTLIRRPLVDVIAEHVRNSVG
jgi:thioesterase domain-containing protein